MSFVDRRLEKPQTTLPAPPTLAQSLLYADTLRAMGREVRLLSLRQGRATMLVRALPFIGRVALVPGSTLWQTNAPPGCALGEMGYRQIKHDARGSGIRTLLINTGSPLEAEKLARLGGLPILTPQTEAQLDLTTPAETRRKHLHGKWRNRLVRIENQGLSVTISRFKPDRDRWILEAELAQRKARGYRALPPDFTLTAAALAPDQVMTASARYRGRVLGAMIFLLHEGAATYHIGVRRPEGQQFALHTLLLWRASLELAKAGVRRLDLGPVETEQETGLARFKLGTGARPIQRGATFLWTPLTSPLGRLAARFSPAGARAAGLRNDPSSR